MYLEMRNVKIERVCKLIRFVIYLIEACLNMACFSFSSATAYECSISPYCAQDCGDIQDMGFETSGVYRIYPAGIRNGIEVYCDMETDDGGWLVSFLCTYIHTHTG